jgi:hypothetical protein
MSNIPALSQTEALGLIKSALPQRVMQLLQGQQGEGILASVAKVAAVLSARWATLYQDRYYLQSTRGRYATVSAVVTWTAGVVDAVELEAGQVVLETRWGVQYVLGEVLSAPAGAPPGYSATVQLRSLYRTHEADIEQSHLDAWPPSLTEGVDPAASIMWADGVSPAAQDEFLAGVGIGTITIAATGDASGGRLPLLDLLAQGQGVIPGEEETDSQLANRLRRPQEVHSPDAILDAVNAVLTPFGVVATLEEPWTYAMTWEGTDMASGSGAWGVAPWGRRGFFVIRVPNFGYEPDGFAWGATPSSGAWGVHPWGSEDVSYLGVIQGLQDLVDRLSLAGVKGLVVADNVGLM